MSNRSSVLLRAALLLLAPTACAYADTFTVYTLQSTFNAPGTGGNINGTLTYDVTTNMFTAVNATTSNFPTANGSNGQNLNFIQFQGTDPTDGDYGVLFGNITGAGVFLDLPSSNLNMASLALCTTTSACSDGATQYSNTSFTYSAVSGSLTSASSPSSVTPEPSTLALLGTGIFGVAGVLRRRTVGNVAQ